ncbi:DUF5673 domain-containing protein [Falsibacillus albus]|uniref:DUF5673 domain-containing protein n=1 Tax=Falsibacillus albus TaxID=2478915 RepID=A0A3L7K1B5_9BACI|nr:DUF5673 domain-containing protein [Falsibacillus albus]RLQ96580.1 hypothetical protein D9X91_05595 [Falsibacillus albus]
MDIGNFIHISFITLVCGIVIFVYFELIINFHQRGRLGKVEYPKNQQFDEYSLFIRWKTSEDRLYRTGIYLAYAWIIFVLFAWSYNVFVEPFYGLTAFSALPYILFFSNIIEIRERGLLINGLLVPWEDIERYKWDQRKENASLVLIYKQRKMGFKRFRSAPMPYLLSTKLEKIMNEQAGLKKDA